MAEVTSATAAATAAGAGAFFLAAIDLHPSLLLFGIVGAIVGLTWAPPQQNRHRAILLLIATAFVSASFGAWIGEWKFPGSLHAAKALAAAFGAVLHPALSALIAALPGLWSAFTQRIGGKT